MCANSDQGMDISVHYSTQSHLHGPPVWQLYHGERPSMQIHTADSSWNLTLEFSELRKFRQTNSSMWYRVFVVSCHWAHSCIT